MGGSEEPVGQAGREGGVTWSIEITPSALQMLQSIRDRRIQDKLVEAIDGLAHEPERQGKPLTAEFQGYRSLRAVAQRYRIIYKVEHTRVIVIVVAVGLRRQGDKRDVYRLAQRLVRLAMLHDSEENTEK